MSYRIQTSYENTHLRLKLKSGFHKPYTHNEHADYFYQLHVIVIHNFQITQYILMFP